MPDTLSDAADRIMADPAPVVFVDTCSVLDLLRTYRLGMKSDIISAASELVRRATASPRAAWLVAAELVQIEWSDHYDGHVQALKGLIREVDGKLVHLIAAARLAIPTRRTEDYELSSLGLEGVLSQIGQALVDASISIADEQSMAQGRQRAKGGLPPAQKGKREYKDCEIIEHYLGLTLLLRSRSFNLSCVFVSSNSHDYGPAPTPNVPLDQDFAAVRLAYVSNLTWALSLI